MEKNAKRKMSTEMLYKVSKSKERIASQKRKENIKYKSFKSYKNIKYSLNIMNNTNENNYNRDNKESKIYENDNLMDSISNIYFENCEINKDRNINNLKTRDYDLDYPNNNINISFSDNLNLNKNDDMISKIETNDSPVNISDKREEKSLLHNHHHNNHFIKERLHKIYKNIKKHLTQTQSLYYNIGNLESTDENCSAHKTYLSINYTNNKSSLKDNSISSYKKKFKNLTSKKNFPISRNLNPSQIKNLCKQKNFTIENNKDINDIKIKNNNLVVNKKEKINLCYFLLKKTKENDKVKILIENFLDIKSLIILSSINKKYYIKYRHFLFEYLYNECFESSNKRKFEMKSINSIFQFSSKDLKNKKNLKNIYHYCKTKSKYESDILKDLGRTFPRDKSFSKESENYKKLYNILISYSNYNKNIGYTQGMNFLGAISLFLFESEVKCFLFLDSLINRFELYNFYGIDAKNKIISKLLRYSYILNKYVPDIISYFNKQQISHDFFSTEWILTLFSNSMKKELLITSWAFMIIFGWKFFDSFVIQILIYYKEDIININVDNICMKMKGILKEKKFEEDYNNIIKKTFHFMNNNIIL